MFKLGRKTPFTVGGLRSAGVAFFLTACALAGAGMTAPELTGVLKSRGKLYFALQGDRSGTVTWVTFGSRTGECAVTHYNTQREVLSLVCNGAAVETKLTRPAVPPAATIELYELMIKNGDQLIGMMLGSLNERDARWQEIASLEAEAGDTRVGGDRLTALKSQLQRVEELVNYGRSVLDAMVHDALVGKNRLPEEVGRILANADQFELISIDPRGGSHDSLLGFRGFHGCKILGRTMIKDSAIRENAAQVMMGAMEGLNDSARCFTPRLGIRARLGDGTVELVVCFECGRLESYSAPSAKAQWHTISREAEPFFDRLLREAGIPKAK